MAHWKFVSIVLLVSLSLSGCYLRKSDDEEFPDEFAQGLDYAEESKIDYVEMDDASDVLNFDENPTDLIASADHGAQYSNDANPYLKKTQKESASIWDTPPSDSEEIVDSLDNDPTDSLDLGNESRTGIVGGAISGAPIEGLSPPRTESASSNSLATEAQRSGRNVSDSINSSGLGGFGDAESVSELSFGQSPDMLAKVQSDFDMGKTPFERSSDNRSFNEPDSFSNGREDFLKSREQTLSNLDNDLRNASVPVPDMPTADFDGSRAAQAIGSAAGSTRQAEKILAPSNQGGGLNTIPQSRSITIDGSQGPVSNQSKLDPVSTNNPGQTMLTPETPVTVRAELPDARTLKKQGIDYYHDRNFSAAITAFRDYLSAYSEEEDAVRAWLGYALMQDRRFGEASKEFTTLLNSDNPELRADAHYYLGSIHEKQGDFEAAKVRWEQVIEFYPNSKAAEKAQKSLDTPSP